MVEMSPEGIAIHSEGKVVFANPSALRTMGALRPEDLIGRSVLDLVHPDYHAVVAARLATLQRGEAVPFVEEKLLRLDGTAVDAALHGNLVVKFLPVVKTLEARCLHQASG